MSRLAKIDINLVALQHNLQKVKEIASQSKVLAMVKGNAYGHGIKKVIGALSLADGFGVICLKEARLIRELGSKKLIVFMSGFFDSNELPEIINLDSQIVVHCVEQVEALEKMRLVDSVVVWLKIDTGMHRLGFSPNEVSSIYHRLINCKNVKKPLRIMTHFSHADNPDLPYTERQINLFNEITSDLLGEKSLANSSGILKFPNSHADWIRPGGCLYGVLTLKNAMGIDYGFNPVMTLRSVLIAVHHRQKGDKLGYEGLWRCPEDMPVGVVAIGYADGYPGYARCETPVLVNGKVCALVGRVATDVIMVDLRNCPDAKIGDEIVLWGEGLPAEIVAKHLNGISYNLVSGVTWRVRPDF